MTKANRKHIDRRAAIKGAAITTAAGIVSAAALRASIAAEHDPILDLIAEADRLRALAEAADERAEACRLSVNDDCSGCGWPPLTPEGAALHIPGEIGKPVYPYTIEQYNEGVSKLAALFADTPSNATKAAEIAKECAARVAWLDRRVAEREENARRSGYLALDEEATKIWDQWSDTYCAACRATAVTVAGAMAQFRMAIEQIKTDHTMHGVFDRDGLDIDETATLNAYETLARLLPNGDLS